MTTTETTDTTTKTTDTTTETTSSADPAATNAEEPAAENAGDGNETGREAAKWRRKLRDVEAERDGLAAQLEETQRRLLASELDRLPVKLADPGDLERFGTPIGELVDEAGAIDAEKVAAAVAGLLDERPYLAAPKATPPPSQKAKPDLKGGSDPTTSVGLSWGDVLNAR